jgi:uncharacterized protein YkwD
MVKKLFIVTALLALALSACSGGNATEPPASTATEPPEATALVSITDPPATTEAAVTPSDTAAVTDTPSTPFTATPTAGTPIPTNPPDCTNSALFVTDVTIPDNTNIVGGTKFTKTWRISNNGTCVWGPTYTLSHYSDQRLGAPDSVPLGLTYPGSTLDISVELTAPNSTGTYRGNFVIKNPQGLIMKVADDSRLWVIINVTTVSAATVAVTSTSIGPSPTLATPAGSVTPTPTGPTPTQGASSSSSTAACAFTTERTKLTEVINALNTYRAQKGLPAYTVNAKLAEAAQRHANDIACHKIYVHTGTDGSTPRSRVADTGYVAKSVSENVNGNNPPFDGQAAVNWWINDRGDARHGQNLVSTTFTEIGVGYAFFESYGFYALVFAQP